MKVVPGALKRRFFRSERGYLPERPEQLKMQMIVTADWHTDGDIVRDRTDVLRRALAGISDTRRVPDALLIAGDLTNSAHLCEYDNMKQLTAWYNRVPKIIPVIGNHDCRFTDMEPRYEVGLNLFCDYCRDCGYNTNYPYYVTEANGYPVVILGSENLRALNRHLTPWFADKNFTDSEILNNMAYISPDQLNFLDRVMAAASHCGKPIIVSCHQPLNTMPGVMENWRCGILGEQSDAVQAILQKYADAGTTILYISGHLHTAVGTIGLQQLGNRLFALDVPSMEYTNGGGEGYVLEAYEDKLRLRGRNFIDGEWLQHADFTILLDALH